MQVAGAIDGVPVSPTPDDGAWLATALVEAIEHYVPTWPGLRDAAMARVRRLTWTDTAQRTLAAYRDAMHSD